MHARRIFVAALFCSLTAAGLFAGKKGPESQVDLSQLDFRTGDIVFQHLPGKLGSVICEVTNCPLSHCGMIVIRKGEPYVIEAIGPVRYLSLRKWLKQGDMSRFMQMRLKQVSEEQIAKVVASAEAFLGRPYDIQSAPGTTTREIGVCSRSKRSSTPTLRRIFAASAPLAW